MRDALAVPTWSARAHGAHGAHQGTPKQFHEIAIEEMARHVRTTQQTLQMGLGGGVGGALADAQRDGLCYSLSSLDNVGTCMASEEDRMQDAAAWQARQVRRPTIEAAGMLSIPPPQRSRRCVLFWYS